MPVCAVCPEISTSENTLTRLRDMSTNNPIEPANGSSHRGALLRNHFVSNGLCTDALARQSIRQRVPSGVVGNPKTRSEERAQIKASGGILKRGGGRYKKKPAIAGLTTAVWREMSTPIQQELINLSKVVDVRVATRDRITAFTGGVADREASRIRGILDLFKGSNSLDEPKQLRHLEPSSRNSHRRSSNNGRSFSRVESLVKSWVKAGNKWPASILQFAGECVEKYEHHKGQCTSTVFKPDNPGLKAGCCSANEFLKRPVAVFDPFIRSTHMIYSLSFPTHLSTLFRM